MAKNGILERINALDGVVHRELKSPFLAMAPQVRTSIIEMLELLRALALEQEIQAAQLKALKGVLREKEVGNSGV